MTLNCFNWCVEGNKSIVMHVESFEEEFGW